MTDQNGVSRNPLQPRSRAGIFHGRGAIRVGRIAVLAITPILSIFPAACGEKDGKGDSAVRGNAPQRLNATAGLMDEGDEVFLDARTEAMASEFGDETGPGAIDAGSRGRWSLMLVTVGGDAHPIQARAIREDIVRTFPELREIFIRSTSKGSAIWLGRFASAADPAAAAARDRIKSKQRNGRAAFPRAFLSVLPDDSPMGERDLRRLRMMYPRVDPLYTLQVACWGTFGTDEISWEEVRRAAEAKCSELGRRGFDAWYHHDSVTEMSVVTVGVFDSRAYDGRSTLFSAEVEALFKDFPVHLINGEEAAIELRPGDTSTQVPQQCRLVSVPEAP